MVAGKAGRTSPPRGRGRQAGGPQCPPRPARGSGVLGVAWAGVTRRKTGARLRVAPEAPLGCGHVLTTGRLARPGKDRRTHTRNRGPSFRKSTRNPSRRQRLRVYVYQLQAQQQMSQTVRGATPTLELSASNGERNRSTGSRAAGWPSGSALNTREVVWGLCVCFSSNKTNIFPSPRANSNKASLFRIPLIPKCTGLAGPHGSLRGS